MPHVTDTREQYIESVSQQVRQFGMQIVAALLGDLEAPAEVSAESLRLARELTYGLNEFARRPLVSELSRFEGPLRGAIAVLRGAGDPRAAERAETFLATVQAMHREGVAVAPEVRTTTITMNPETFEAFLNAANHCVSAVRRESERPHSFEVAVGSHTLRIVVPARGRVSFIA